MKPVPVAKNGQGRKAFWLRLAGTLLALVLLVVLFWQQGWDEILAALRGIAAWRLLLALVLMIGSRLAISLRWHVLLRAAGLPITPGQTLRVTFAGLFSNNFLPTTIGGDVVRLAGAARLGYDGAVCAASLVADRLVGMTGMAMVLPFGLPAIPSGAVPSVIPNGASLLAVVGTDAASSSPTAPLHKRIWDRGWALARRLWQALLTWRKQPRALFVALLLSLVHQACLYGFLFLLFEGMGQSLPFGWLAGLYSLVYFITLLPISINGYGLQEFSMTLVYARFAGASLASGLTAALLFRTMMMLVSVPGALFIPGLLPGEGTPGDASGSASVEEQTPPGESQGQKRS